MGGGGRLTAYQHQCLLAALGLYPANAIDGIWGEKSRTAARALQSRMGLTADGAVGDETEKALLRCLEEGLPEPPEGEFWKELRYWNREEFRCKCGGKYCSGFPAEPSETLVRLAEDTRAHFGRPAHASSGLRCPEHNRREGGVENSRHLWGKALDFRVEGTSGQEVLSYVKADKRTRYAYIIGRGPYVHVDVE